MATPAAAQPSQKKRAREIKKQAVKRMVHGDVASAERPRPQLLFSDAPDNSNAPFQPKLSFWKVADHLSPLILQSVFLLLSLAPCLFMPAH